MFLVLEKEILVALLSMKMNLPLSPVTSESVATALRVVRGQCPVSHGCMSGQARDTAGPLLTDYKPTPLFLFNKP